MGDAVMNPGKARVWIILAVLWSLFDVAVHIWADRVEPLRIVGNAVLILSAMGLWLRLPGLAKLALGLGGSLVIIGLNASHALSHGAPVPMLTFIGVGLGLLMVAALVSSAAWMSRWLRWSVAAALAVGGVWAVAIAGIAGAS